MRDNCKDLFQRKENAIIEQLLEDETDLQKVVENKLSFEDLKDIKQLDLYTLNIAFQLIPQKTDNKEHKKIVKEIIYVFIEKLVSDKDSRIDYRVRHSFLEKFAYFVLSSPKEEIRDYLKPFLNNFNSSEAISNLFEEFIYAEDYLDIYDNFWEVWNIFNLNVVELSKNGDRYSDKIVKSYLFAQNSWKETATKWHTLKNENKVFFKIISEKIGHCPSVLYAISKLLNNIGSPYLNDGVSWISNMLRNNGNL